MSDSRRGWENCGQVWGSAGGVWPVVSDILTLFTDQPGVRTRQYRQEPWIIYTVIEYQSLWGHNRTQHVYNKENKKIYFYDYDFNILAPDMCN